ncbi:MAG: Nif3-like dinuclear metal center hexameric protein [Bacteroides sp.]|jgi:dinuclear metal center YbgI/SA1388 family protein|nr:Nif3-like dinuclear metal center hexameric protein [Bacteroides sp.]
MKLRELLNVFERFAPGSLQESYDNSGLQLGSPEQEVHKGLICLDVTPAVVEEAVAEGCDLVLSHHPLLFKGLKKITGGHFTERVIIEAIKHDIAIVSMHTNLDNIDRGVNFMLGKKLGLQNLKILQPQKGLLRKLVTFCPHSHAEKVRSAIFKAGAGHIGDYDCCSYAVDGHGTFRAGKDAKPFVGKQDELHVEPEVRIETILPAYLESSVVAALLASHPYEEVAYDIYPLENVFERTGSGMIGELEIPLSENDFLEKLKRELKVPCLRHTAFNGKAIKKVAFCGGAGSFLMERARQAGADAFVTGDMKYHDFFEASDRLLLVDAGHYETEQFTKDLLYDIVNKNFSKFALLISGVNTNPVQYF